MAATTASSADVGLGRWRWLFFPFAVTSVVAVGVHAGADLIDDRLALIIDAVLEWLQLRLGSFETAQTALSHLGPRERSLFVRALALTWELFADLLFAIPLLNWAVPDTASPLPKPPPRVNVDVVARPVLVAVFAMIGAFEVARVLEARIFVSLTGEVVSAELAGRIARAVAVAAGLLVAVRSWLVAVRGSLYSASSRKNPPRLAGWCRTLIGIPLVVELIIHARALASVLL